LFINIIPTSHLLKKIVTKHSVFIYDAVPDNLFLLRFLFFSLLVSSLKTILLSGASCAICYNAIVCRSRGLIAIENGRYRLGHRAQSHFESRWIRSFSSPSCQKTLKKAGHRFWPMSLFVSLRISRFLPLLLFFLSLSLSFSLPRDHKRTQSHTSRTRSRSLAFIPRHLPPQTFYEYSPFSPSLPFSLSRLF